MCRRKGKAWILLLVCVSVWMYFIIIYLKCRQSYKYVRHGQPYCYFRLLVVIRICIWGTFFELATVENPRFAVWISTLSIIVPEIWVLPVWRPYCYFRLSVVDAFISGHFLLTRHDRKSEICRRNFDAICHSARNMSTSGLGGHIATAAAAIVSDTVRYRVHVLNVELCILYYSETCYQLSNRIDLWTGM